MANECDKHPDKFMGLNAAEAAKEFGKTNYFFQRDFYTEMVKEYGRQSDADRTRKPKTRGKLAGGLEWLAQSINESVMNSMNYVCKVCKPYMKKRS